MQRASLLLLVACGPTPTPQILVVTRLIPEAGGTTCNQRLEAISGTTNSRILRVPFRSTSGEVLPHWISRFEVWPYLERFAIEAEALTPDELLRVLLKTEVDLLWFGGIGTYVKAADESHADVGDRSNDTVRVNANEVRCKVIGEGGNLGLTQCARIEYARLGGRCDTGDGRQQDQTNESQSIVQA